MSFGVPDLLKASMRFIERIYNFEKNADSWKEIQDCQKISIGESSEFSGFGKVYSGTIKVTGNA